MLPKAVTQAITTAVRSQMMVQSKRTCYPYHHRLNVTPPRNRIAFAEKLFWGIFIAGSIMSVPAWILVHHREYGGGGA